MLENKDIIVRFAPSPTGFLHIGSARTALFNCLFAKGKGGKFILRIEDTDRERSKKEFEDDILEGLSWLGMEWDGLYRQSERGEMYKKHLQKMLDDGSAYVSKETEGDRKEVIRFKNPNKKIKFEDIVRGGIEFDTEELGDFIIARSIDEPLYHLAVVVDDLEMGVSHVIRGEDHISNTPRQILLIEALGAPRPLYAHIPLILAPDKSKLSKRHGAVSVGEYKKLGYLPEAVVNYLALLGWNPGEGEEREIFSPGELAQKFDLGRVNKSAAVFSYEKLDWFNKEHIKNLSDDKFAELSAERLPEKYGGEILKKIVPILRERISKFSELEEMERAGEFSFFFEAPEYKAEGLLWKGKQEVGEAAAHLIKVSELADSLPENFSADEIKGAIWSYAEEVGRGEVLWPMRYALSGRERSPDPFVIASILGKSETLARIKTAVVKLNK